MVLHNGIHALSIKAAGIPFGWWHTGHPIKPERFFGGLGRTQQWHRAERSARAAVTREVIGDERWIWTGRRSIGR